MGETTDQLKAQIADARSRLGQNLNELEYRVKNTADWRFQFDRHPWPFIAAGFTGGLVLSWMIGRR